MKKFSKEEFLMAAGLAEVSMIDAKHTVSYLDEIHPDEHSENSENYETLKQYLSDRHAYIDKELASGSNDNIFLAAYYNGVKIELKAIEMVLDALIQKQIVLHQMSKDDTPSL